MFWPILSWHGDISIEGQGTSYKKFRYQNIPKSIKCANRSYQRFYTEYNHHNILGDHPKKKCGLLTSIHAFCFVDQSEQ